MQNSESSVSDHQYIQALNQSMLVGVGKVVEKMVHSVVKVLSGLPE